LAPEALGAKGHGLGGDPGQRLRRAEDVDDVHGNRHISEALEALLAQNLGLAGIDRYDAEPGRLR
jgi:hypothetical protein